MAEIFVIGSVYTDPLIKPKDLIKRWRKDGGGIDAFCVRQHE